MTSKITEEMAVELFALIKDKFDDTQKLEVVKQFREYYEARLNEANCGVIRFKTEASYLNEILAKIDKNPIKFFEENGPWGVEKPLEYIKAEKDYNTACLKTDLISINNISGGSQTSTKHTLAENFIPKSKMN